MADEFQRFWVYGRNGRSCEKTSLWSWLTWAWSAVSGKDNHDAFFTWRDPVPALMMILRGVLLRVRRGVLSVLGVGVASSVAPGRAGVGDLR